MGMRVFLCALAVGYAHAAVLPDKNAILSQLKKNGACCTALDYFLPNKVHFNDLIDLDYAASQQSFWSAQAKSLTPTCIVIPTTSQDVSDAVKILNIAYQASIPGCKFAIRGAGHTPQAGVANIDDGVTIDMQSMNQVTVSSDQKIVSIGPGNRWGNIYPTLDGMNLAMVGGRVSPVGSGGLITGGGVSFFSGRYGFSCDNIENFEVVLANGTIANANSRTNPTLFKALKGGNNNFAIVTRFDAKVFPQNKLWGGSIAQPITNKEELFDFFTNFTRSETYDPYSAIISDFAWIAGVPTLIHQVAYTNDNAAWPPPAFAGLDAMPKLTTTVRKDKLTSFTNELAATAAPTNGRYNLFQTVTFINKPGVSEAFMADVFELADTTAKEFFTVLGAIFTMTFQPLPHVLYSKSAATGGNVLGLERFKDDFVNILWTVSWQLPTDGARAESMLQTLLEAIIELAKERGLYSEFVYLNYAASWQDPIQGYGNANVEFMRSVSRRYDPNGLFQKAVPGGWKLQM